MDCFFAWTCQSPHELWQVGLPAPEVYIRVSKAESKRARAEKAVSRVQRGQVAGASRYQVGRSAWEAVPDDVYAAAAAAGEKVLVSQVCSCLWATRPLGSAFAKALDRGSMGRARRCLGCRTSGGSREATFLE